MLSSLKTIGSNIREIEFHNCWQMKLYVFQNILRNFPNVKKLTCYNCKFESHLTDSQLKYLELDSLNEVVLNKCNLEVN